MQVIQCIALKSFRVTQLFSNSFKMLFRQNKPPKSRKDGNYPDLTKHNNHMAKCLTPELYETLCKKVTSGGVTLDQCIQTGEAV